MHGDLLLVLLICVLGCAAFLVGVAYCIGWVFLEVGRAFLRLIGVAPTPRPERAGVGAAMPRMCPRSRCQAVEYRPARFCSRCGTKLD